MENPLVVKVLPLPNMPKKLIYTRLGYREKTADKESIFSKYDSVIEEYLRTTKIRIFYKKKAFHIEDAFCHIEGYRFKSDLIRKRFANIREVFLIGATCMKEDFEKIKNFEAQGDLQQAVILDGVLSEKVDWALDFLEKELSAELRRQGKILGQRLSCGYNDFSLQNQAFFYDELEFEQYGITLNENFLMIPEKTVTALLPVKAIELEK